LFNFDARAVVQKLNAPVTPAKPQASKLSAQHWFDLAVELEESSVTEAQRAYHMALEQDSKMADAHLNLGKLYHDLGEMKKAEAHYRAAAESAPMDPAPRFNLGVLLDDARQTDSARRAYEEAIRLDPCFADAHYNLALLCESLNKKAEALAHFRTARKLYLNK
jgi:tetratricopeptide (TPR) repeat protein